MKQTYNKFPDYYNEIIRWNWYDIDSEMSFLKEMISHYGKWRSILEFACWTGTIAHNFTKSWYSVKWVDLSPQMIEKAWKGDFHVGDMTEAQFEWKFDIILCNYNSVCHLPDWASWIAFFENAYNHLDTGGIIIFDILTLFEFENIARDFRWFFNVGDDTICLEMFTSLEWEVKQVVYTWLIKMFVQQSDKSFQCVEEEIREISFPIDDITDALQKVWFTIQHTEDFHFGEVTSESERVYFVASK